MSADQPYTVKKLSGSHNHTPEDEEMIRRTTIQKMKAIVTEDSRKSVKQVYNETVATAAEHLRKTHPQEQVGISLPTYDSVATILQSTRSVVRPPLPKLRSEIKLDGLWTTTTDGRKFLQIDDGTSNRILGFSTDELMECLCAGENIFMDGTFSTVPEIFSQLYTLHTFHRGQMIPVAYFLLPDKEKDTYKRMLNLLRSYAASLAFIFRPRCFYLDFEIGMLKAIEEVFPQAERRGSLFNFSQCLWRKIQKLGLQSHYKDSQVKTLTRSIMALPLVPLNRIDDAWIDIFADAPSTDHAAYPALELFKEYVTDT